MMTITREDLDAGRVDFADQIDPDAALLRPRHPGGLLIDILTQRGITQYRIAKDIGVPQSTIAAIVKGERAITTQMAMRLGRYLDTTARFWVNLQSDYDLRVADIEAAETVAANEPAA